MRKLSKELKERLKEVEESNDRKNFIYLLNMICNEELSLNLHLTLVNSSNEIISKLAVVKLGEVSKWQKNIDKLLFSEKWQIRLYVAPCASKEKIIEVSLVEENNDVIGSLLKRLKELDLSEEEADRLLFAINGEIRAYAALYASKEKIMEHYL